ncbi:hypothetical protein G7Y89_g5607 [Cudoniella acicularis]|uniref:SGNH hydrolase-type esterase domain-containing protein n=1 Tax=Cudoniella acicularis TaxID=354080 RepID=A0A8H4W5K1_9HELO|nr:hypothetical protein G7Y89_g5607 [Cudoniella acicularis]
MLLLPAVLLVTALLLDERAIAVVVDRDLADTSGDHVNLAARASTAAPSASPSIYSGIDTATIASAASSYASSLIAASSVAVYAQPSEPVTQFIALGDSFTAGVGSNGNPDYNSGYGDCSRYDKAYPYQLQNLDAWEEFNGGVTPVINFGACTGAKMRDLVDRQLNLGDGTWRDVPYHDFGRPQLAVMTISGNDVGFTKILDASDCQTTLNDVQTQIASEQFELDLIDTLSRVALRGRTAAGATPPNSFQVYISGYVPFWNDVDMGCDEISWSIYPWREAKLTTTLRKQMNDLVDDLNTMIQTVANGLHDLLGTVYVDGISDSYIGHRFCEPAPPDYLQSPVVAARDRSGSGDFNEIYFRLNASIATDAANQYCTELVSNKTVLRSGNSGPEPYIVHQAGENGTDLILSVLYDEAACPTDHSNTTLDFSTFTSAACNFNFIYPFTLECVQDSTWGDYNANYTLMGGVFMDSCALWVVQGVVAEDYSLVIPSSMTSIPTFSAPPAATSTVT